MEYRLLVYRVNDLRKQHTKEVLLVRGLRQECQVGDVPTYKEALVLLLVSQVV